MQNQYIGGELPKKGVWTVCKIKRGGGGLDKKEGVVFLMQVDNPMHTMLQQKQKRERGCLLCKIFPEEIENIFFEILLPKTKPVTVRIIYQPPSQKNIWQTLNENFVNLSVIIVIIVILILTVIIINFVRCFA